MKIKILPLIVLAALAATSSYGQGRIVEVDNLATLQSRRFLSNETVRVRGYSTPADWGDPRDYYYQTSSPTVTNAVMFPAVGGGRYYHPWKDGDVAVFGVFPSTSDISTSLNAAIAYGASNGIPVNLRIVGDYTVTSPVLIPNNATFTMANGATLVRKFRSDVAGFAVPNEATVVNSGTTNWQTLGELTLVNSNITLTGISCRTDETNYMGGHIVMQGVADLVLDRINIGRTYRYWAVHIAASNFVVNLPKIRNGGEDSNYVYQDGIHITGGRYGRIIGPDVVSGDDSIAFGQHGMPIRDVVVTGGNLFSTHAQGLRGYIGYDYATNLIERIGIYNVTVSSGTRNGVMQTGTASTNISRPFRNWSIDGILAVSKQSGTNPVAFDAGLIVRNFDGLTLKNASVDFSIEPNLLLLDCDNTTVENCTFGGTGWTTYNQSIRIERAENTRLLNNTIINSNTNSAYGLYLVSSGNTKVEGNVFNTWSSCASIAGSNRTVIFKRNQFTATGGSQRALLVSDPSTNLVFALNEITAPASPSYPGGSWPDNYIIEYNFGWPNPNTDIHSRADNFGPHVRYVQSSALSTNSVYSTSNRLRLKNENTGLFFASWDPGSTVFYTIGDSSAQTSPRPATIQGEGASGTNVATGNLTIRPGQSTGNATPPSLVFQVHAAGASGSSGQSTVDGLTIKTTSLVTNQAVILPSVWGGASFLQKQMILTNIGGVNYWISP